MSVLSRYRIVFFLLVAVFIFSGTFIVIQLASGYHFDLESKSFLPRGILFATSEPIGAEFFVNGKLKGATNSSIFLAPNEYLVEIKKNGFVSWQKKITIKKELVVKTDAYLFPMVSDLRPITYTGAQNPKLSPDGTKIVYSIPLPSVTPSPLSQSKTATGSPTLSLSTNEAGLWVLDLTDFLFNISRSPKQIIQSKPGKDFANFDYSWTPDSRQILLKPIAGGNQSEQYLIDPSTLNSITSLVDITSTLPQLNSTWVQEEQVKFDSKLQKTPKEMQEILTDKAKNIIFSPDGTKVLYEATASATIPENLISDIVAASTQKESRTIQPGNIYVYDLAEDKNFLIPVTFPTATITPAPKATKKITGSTASLIPNFERKQKTSSAYPSPLIPISWLPTSRHLFWIDSTSNDKVVSCEYDGMNLTTIYSGPLIKPYVFTAPGKDKLVILSKINFEPNSSTNLYSVSLK